ncbi:YibE/F family protein [Spirochaetes bacterium]|uniref:YibE/F family protein n=1 Tax=Candidatus Scatousia excrementipullorum TaxID=2840936 RepID=A0A9D9DP73_9BACT|nr:YibE/F family protein [Candidatus Scatousia excrementipullorum]
MKRLFLLLILFFNLCIMPVSALEMPDLPSEVGKVESISYEDVTDGVQSENNVKQKVLVKILTGQFKGEEVELDNMLTSNPAYDIILNPGDRVILHVEAKNTEILSSNDVDFFIADIKRDNALWFFGGLFTVLVMIIGKKKGVFSIVSILATVALIFFMLVPMILNGFCPIASAVLVGILSTVITIYLVAGFNSKSSSAVIGTSLSLIVAGALSLVAIYLAHLSGFAGEESMFLYSTRPDLSFKGILSASMIIAALGALMDTGVSIASAINEIYETDKSLSTRQLFKSGMNVGRDVIGTMSNTLILVYLGSALPLVLLSSNIDLQKFFNLNQVATEISSALIGSIAILACVPLTALISAYLIKHQKKPDKFEMEQIDITE